jgi:DNA-directed RNA polymerase specialized sigma24 family protein
LSSSNSSSQPPDATGIDDTHLESVENTQKRKVKWALSRTAFDELLSCFSSNRDEAGIQYEIARRKVVRFFEWRSVVNAEDYADETFNRAARRIDQGENVDNLMAYLYAVAHLIFKEYLKERERMPIALDDAPAKLIKKMPETDGPDMRRLCFDQCLEELARENRNLLLSYYEGERRSKIDHRQVMADGLGIPINALRIRVHRIRKTLEGCIAECL